MRFLHTLYIDPSKGAFTDSFGWLKPEYHLMSWALSCLQLKKIYGDVELYANSAGAELLVDMLRLPYTNVHITHDDLKLDDVDLWALPKIYTYSLQKEPFLHVDGDVFIFDKFNDALLQSPLIAQNFENSTYYSALVQQELMQNLSYFPSCVKAEFESSIPIKGVNAGILGGTDIAFITEYAYEAFEYINRNVNQLSSINVDRFNMFYEQHLFYSMAKERNLTIGFFIGDAIDDIGYQYLDRFHEVPFVRNYLHLLGHFKRDEFTCLQMAAKLRELYPEYYYRIIALCLKNNVPLFTNFYSDKAIETKCDYHQLIDTSTDCFVCNISTNSSDQKESEPDLRFLMSIFNAYSNLPNAPFDLLHFKDDFNGFSAKLILILNKNTTLSEYYLYGRDLKSVEWYPMVFADLLNSQHISLVQTRGLHIIESSFNWAGLLNKHYRVGILYYEKLTVSEGVFFNLVVPETIGSKFLLHDIDELAKMVLELLSEPMSIRDLMTAMQQYFENDVIQNHYDAFKRLIEKVIRQLILLKAIQPLQ